MGAPKASRSEERGVVAIYAAAASDEENAAMDFFSSLPNNKMTTDISEFDCLHDARASAVYTRQVFVWRGSRPVTLTAYFERLGYSRSSFSAAGYTRQPLAGIYARPLAKSALDSSLRDHYNTPSDAYPAFNA